MNRNKYLPFWLITLAVMIGLPLVTLIQDGMFMDAMLYTSVAHNQAHGFGTFWFPQFSKLNLDLPGFNSFHEQPPLAFGIESLFFRVLGNSMYVERFYVLVTMCLTAWLIYRLWQEVYKNEVTLRRLGWLPLLLWITIPTVFWGCSNNVNENTMGIFTLASVLVSFRLLQRDARNLFAWMLVGLLIFLATFTKGFPGFFPIVVPVVYWFATRRISAGRAFGYSTLLLAVPLAIYGILFLVPESRDSLSIYLFKRALLRITSDPTTSNRFASLVNLFMDLLPQLGLLLIIVLVARAKKIKAAYTGGQGGLILFFLLTGLSATAPLMLTMVQKAFYLLPGFPFFAIGTGMLLAPYISRFTEKMQTGSKGFRIFRGISVLLLCSAITVVGLQAGKVGREKDVLHDVYAIGKLLPEHSVIGINQRDFYIDWELQCYLMRYFFISVDFKPGKPLTYFILDKSLKTDTDLSRYKKMELGLEKYDLYKLEP
ncbi:ArnT family glycosyltransferase [Taibaiella chishuiensis]|uniref:Dolichyl-phosphate-mannose-protein mannosyltransferase n=1 Tax=Taibaiella chishuiensis TaxID=1434707 RepID=A0A2P8DAM4_9BACT|nr:glycosyltransferase family 39 protein [Taibaiella chishuiensis]PSK94247.1 dolichyl-phosphate-mannose-protein mannosyltransferase [Taibaiella chishuiensis]